MTRLVPLALGSVFLCAIMGSPVSAQGSFVLTSPDLIDGTELPADLKCMRDGGKGLSPALAWKDVPEGTRSLALIMHHYPRGTVEGKDAPSQYWLLWNVPAETRGLSRGNPDSIGDEGSDKDGKRTGYTPPCSPKPWWSFNSGPQHEYTITLYALSRALSTLPARDDADVDWEALTKA